MGDTVYIRSGRPLPSLAAARNIILSAPGAHPTLARALRHAENVETMTISGDVCVPAFPPNLLDLTLHDVKRFVIPMCAGLYRLRVTGDCTFCPRALLGRLNALGELILENDTRKGSSGWGAVIASTKRLHTLQVVLYTQDAVRDIASALPAIKRLELMMEGPRLDLTSIVVAMKCDVLYIYAGGYPASPVSTAAFPEHCALTFSGNVDFRGLSDALVDVDVRLQLPIVYDLEPLRRCRRVYVEEYSGLWHYRQPECFVRFSGRLVLGNKDAITQKSEFVTDVERRRALLAFLDAEAGPVARFLARDGGHGAYGAGELVRTVAGFLL